MSTTYFPDGTVYTSTALTPSDMDVLFQLLITQMLGIAADFDLECQVTIDSPIIKTPLVVANIQPGFFVVGSGIPLGTFIQSMVGQGSDLVMTLSNPVNNQGAILIGFYDMSANTRVRLSWQTQGMPAFAIDDDVMFIRCTEEMTEYSEIRNEMLDLNDDQSATQIRVYTRSWSVFFRARGPNSFDSIRLVKSMLLTSVSHDALASSNLYLTSAMGTPQRVPELFEGQWWEQVDVICDFFEQVTETTIYNPVKSVEIIGFDETKEIFDITPAIL
jgi:hypothetical protein